MSFDQEKLKNIAAKYAATLPERLHTICNDYMQLASKWSADSHRALVEKIHKLTGSAGAYGFSELSDLSANIEILIKQIENSEDLQQCKKDLDQLFCQLSTYQLKDVEESLAKHHSSDLSAMDESAICCLVQEDDQSKINKMLTDTGYKLAISSDSAAFIEALELAKPGIAIIDVLLLENMSPGEINDFKTTYLKNAIVIAISRSSVFKYRELAARLNAFSFITWPISADQLLDVLKRINAFNHISHRILIVDDEEDIARYYSNLLQSHGLATEVLMDVHQIDDVLHYANPDLILMDLRMPNCDGSILAQIIRQQSVYENVPIIFLSGEQEYSKQLMALSSGADDFISKKITPDLLVLAIKNKLRSYSRLCRHINKDLLTGEYNQGEILRILDLHMQEARRVTKPLTAAVLKISGYDAIISTYGSVAGDQVMRALSGQLRKDLHPRDVVGRVGQDAFIVLFPDTDIAETVAMLEEVRQRYSSITFWLDHRATAAAFSYEAVEVKKQETCHDVLDECFAAVTRSGEKVT